jgi:pyridinium-3,5-biscarboxylic acid mononucleotide synthase
MSEAELKKILEEVKKGKTDIAEAVKKFKDFSYTDIGFAKIDHHRELRTGYPEIIFGSGKTPDQLKCIVELMLKKGNNVLATRCSKEQFDGIKKICKEAKYHEVARIISVKQKAEHETKSYIAIVTAGTSDIGIAEEAAVTAEFFGNKVKRIYDVGVAGIHRLFKRLDDIRGAKVCVVIAGMEGALPSVVGGLVDKPVIAVPTSIGYGANFDGLSALLGMLTSCANGISVVNIDNGFGAGYMASMINKL